MELQVKSDEGGGNENEKEETDRKDKKTEYLSGYRR